MRELVPKMLQKMGFTGWKSEPLRGKNRPKQS